MIYQPVVHPTVEFIECCFALLDFVRYKRRDYRVIQWMEEYNKEAVDEMHRTKQPPAFFSIKAEGE